MNPLRERLAFAAAVLATALALSGCSEAKPSPGEAKADRPVLVQRVHFEDRRPARTLVGTVRPRYESDLGFRVAENPVHVYDLQATILHMLGFDHERLTYRYQGRDFRLTDVHGKLVTPLLA